jgi:hypothetical protein
MNEILPIILIVLVAITIYNFSSSSVKRGQISIKTKKMSHNVSKGVAELYVINLRRSLKILNEVYDKTDAEIVRKYTRRARTHINRFIQHSHLTENLAKYEGEELDYLLTDMEIVSFILNNNLSGDFVLNLRPVLLLMEILYERRFAEIGEKKDIIMDLVADTDLEKPRFYNLQNQNTVKMWGERHSTLKNSEMETLMYGISEIKNDMVFDPTSAEFYNSGDCMPRRYDDKKYKPACNIGKLRKEYHKVRAKTLEKNPKSSLYSDMDYLDN